MHTHTHKGRNSEWRPVFFALGTSYFVFTEFNVLRFTERDWRMRKNGGQVGGPVAATFELFYDPEGQYLVSFR
jgi:hypothetical protein